MTTPATPDVPRDDATGVEQDAVNLIKADEPTATVPAPGAAAEDPAAAQVPPQAHYYPDQHSYPAQGYPVGDPAVQQASAGYAPPAEPAPAGYPVAPGYPNPAYPNPAPAQAYNPAQAYGTPQQGYEPDPYAAYGSAYGTQGYPGYGGYPPKASTNGLAIASLVLGLGGVAVAACVFFSGFITGLIAIVLGAVGMKQVNAEPVPDGASKGMAIAGMALGGLQLLWSVGMTVAVVVSLAGS